MITGTRAEYGLLRTTIAAIENHPKLELLLVATGLHLLRKFGRTVRHIEQDGWRIHARIPMQRGLDSPQDQAEGLARGVRGMARFLESDNADVVLVLGDRIEAMAGALAGTTMGKIVAHIHGGDVAPGDMDDALRHSITKLAHIHLAATRDAARRIVRMGEHHHSVHIVGAPGLDEAYKIAAESIDPESNGHCSRGVAKKREQATVLYHASGRSATRERQAMGAILRALDHHGLDRIVIGPNADRGHSGVLEAIEQARDRSQQAGNRSHGAQNVRVVTSLERGAYLRTLSDSRLLIGNSSSGIIEAAVLGTPVVNVGSRQAGRLRNGRFVIDSGESYRDICEAIGTALAAGPGRMRRSRRSVYGSGGAGARIAEILAQTSLGRIVRTKRIRY